MTNLYPYRRGTPAQEYRAVLFDQDGTLYDTEGIYINACKEVYQRWGIPIGNNGIVIAARRIEEHTQKAAQVHGIDNKTLRAIQREMVQTYLDKWYDELELMPNVREVIATLRNNKVVLGIVTSSSREQAEYALDRFGLGHFFSVVVTGDDTLIHKPSGVPYQFAKEQIGHDKALAVEDSESGVRSAKNANLDVAAVPTAHTANQSFEQADMVLPFLRWLIA